MEFTGKRHSAIQILPDLEIFVVIHYEVFGITSMITNESTPLVVEVTGYTAVLALRSLDIVLGMRAGHGA